MRKYEVMMILSADLEKEGQEEFIKEFSSVVKKVEGRVEKVNHWGVKSFAYPIENETKGYYLVVELAGSSKIAQMVNRWLKLSEKVIRHLLVRLDGEG